MDIRERPKLRAQLQKWISSSFRREEDLTTFEIFFDPEKLVCLTCRTRGYVFGSKELSGQNYIFYTHDKRELLFANGYICSDIIKDNTPKKEACGFSFQIT